MSNVTAANENNSTFNNVVQLPNGIGLFLVALNILLSVNAFLGNVLILVALHKVSSIYPPTKLLFRCLAVTDLCIGLVSQPLFAMYVMSRVTANINWNDFFMSIFGGISSNFDVVFCGVSILTSTAISVDRLLALLLRLRYRHVVTLRRVRMAIICFWLLCSALYGWMWLGGIVKAGVALIVVITLCVLISLFSYTKIYLRLRHHQSQSHPQVHQAQPPDAGQIPLNIARYKRTVSTIAWVQLALVFCYLPFSIYNMLAFLGGISHEMGEVFVVSFLYLNSSLNPILYCWRIPEVRQVVKDTIRQLNCCAST